jgi:hypothetical protein
VNEIIGHRGAQSQPLNQRLAGDRRAHIAAFPIAAPKTTKEITRFLG